MNGLEQRRKKFIETYKNKYEFNQNTFDQKTCKHEGHSKWK